MNECPVCGAPEGTMHDSDCAFIPWGRRPCCGTWIWTNGTNEPITTYHEPSCQWGTEPTWGGRERMLEAPYAARVWLGIDDPRSTGRAGTGNPARGAKAYRV